MNTKRAFFAAAVGAAAGGLLLRTGLAQPAGQQAQGTRGLRDRGAPRGRIGAATRGDPTADRVLTLECVAPVQGAGLTSIDQPSLFYILLGRATQPMKLVISTPGQLRPVADLELPRARPPGLGVVHLRDHGVRLPPNWNHVWSVALVVDATNPSQDLVASAPIEYRPPDPALEREVRETPLERRPAMLARAGYWYDAVKLAQANSDRDGGATLNALLAREELYMVADFRSAPNLGR